MYRIGCGRALSFYNGSVFHLLVSSMVVVFVLLLSICFSQAKLVFETNEQKIIAKATEPEVTATFGYKNQGKKPVTIQRLKPSCSCLTSDAAGRVVAPGESGKIEARFKVGQRRGVQANTIGVVTSDSESNIRLRFVVVIEDALRLKPQLLVWRVGEEPSPKMISVEVPNEEITEVKLLGANNQAFSVKWEKESDQAHRYKMIVRPESTETKTKARVTILAAGKGFQREYSAYLFVK